MSYLLFIDESGHDRGESPYEVLAGIGIEDRDLWSLTCQIHDAEVSFFGQRVSGGLLELKGKKLLKNKTFRLADQLHPMESLQRSALAKSCLDKGRSAQGRPGGGGVTREELTALAQAKIAFVRQLLDICARFRVKAFASIVDRDALKPDSNVLRKDYSFLFERFYYFLDDLPGQQQGLVVFDELERSQCHILIDQMSKYFRETANGQTRSALIYPEPFFVHSHLTTAIQLADIIAYLIVWGVRVGNMTRPARSELGDLAEKVRGLRYRTIRDRQGIENFVIWSFALIDDLRSRREQ
ncbi:MAG: DUF3800 domain-containing protein [Magnetococcales bacterium]|nr:DUF3800 domain-containing protein [Magnetococcales bacterium]